ncbi:MAG: hypothetical protein AVDCRST_MAG54-4551, partial [uncultured Actinomycetospora sp.]
AAQHRPRPDDPRRQPRPPRAPAGHHAGEGARPALRPRPLRPAGDRGRRRRRRPPARGGDRRRHRRRDGQGQLRDLHPAPARRLRPRLGRAAAPAVVAGRDRRLPRVLRGLPRQVHEDRRADAEHRLRRARPVHRPRRAADRHRQPAQGPRRGQRRRGGLHAVHLAPRVRPQRVLRVRARVLRGGRRGPARGVPGDRRRRAAAAGRRPVAHRDPRGPGPRRRRARPRRPRARRDRQPLPARHPDRPHPPAHLLRPQPRPADPRHRDGRGRAVHARHPGRRVLVRGRQPAAHARVEDLAGPPAARRRGTDPRTARPRPELRGAPGADRRHDRLVRVVRGSRERRRGCGLRVLVAGELLAGGAPERGVGEVPSALRGRGDRDAAPVGL